MGKLETTSTASDECDIVDSEVSDGDDVKLISSSTKHQTSMPEALHFMFPITQGEDARRFQFSNLHPLLTIILYTVVFWVTLVLIQKFDDVGSGWETRKVEETQECRIEQTCEGIHVKTPTCNDEHVQNVVPGWERKPMVKDDPGFCTPTSPWFWYDLGGTMCVCEKSWDVRAYWEKTMTSFAFNFPHFMTPFQIYLVYQRWTWVFIYLLFNEVFEELCMAVTGTWGFTFDPAYDLEPRYDSFIRDVLLCGVPGLCFGIFFVSTIKVPSFWVAPVKASAATWFATGRGSKKHHLKILFQMLVLKQIALVYNTDYGTGKYYPQNVLLITINLALVLSFYLQNINDWPAHCRGNVLRFHLFWGFLSAMVWAFTIYPLLDEVYLLYGAMSVSWILLILVRVATRSSDGVARLVLGLPRDVVRLNGPDYHHWVQTGVISFQLPEEGLCLHSIAKAVELLQARKLVRVHMPDLLRAIGEGARGAAGEEEHDQFRRHLTGGDEEAMRREAMRRMPASKLAGNKNCGRGVGNTVGNKVEDKTLRALSRVLVEEEGNGNERSNDSEQDIESREEEDDEGGGETTPAHLGPAERGMSCFVLGGYALAVVVALMVLAVAVEQPYKWKGIMYRRHWCGLVIEEGGNGCIQMIKDGSFKAATYLHTYTHPFSPGIGDIEYSRGEAMEISLDVQLSQTQ